MIWLGLTFLMVLAAKYYSAVAVKHLETRLNEAKDGIEEAKGRLKKARERQDSAKDQEKNLRFRAERLQALIQDMEADVRAPRRVEEEYEEVSR